MSKNASLNYDTRYPSIADLKQRAMRRLPNFAFDYVDGAIDEELAKRRNRQAFQEVHLTPRYLRDVSSVDTSAKIFGIEYSMGFGVSPVGLGNMMWPGAELALAKAESEVARDYFTRAQELFDGLGADLDAARAAVEIDKISESA